MFKLYRRPAANVPGGPPVAAPVAQPSPVTAAPRTIVAIPAKQVRAMNLRAEVARTCTGSSKGERATHEAGCYETVSRRRVRRGV